MPKFGLGYIPDDPDMPVAYPTHHALTAAGPPTLEVADHTPYRRGIIWQNGVGMCVGSWLKRAVQLWQWMNGHTSAQMISGKFAYDVGRAIQHAGIDPDEAPPLSDIGSKPSLVLLAAHELGVVVDEHYPDPDSPEWDPSTVNRKPTPDALVHAYDFRGLEFYDVLRGAWGFKESIRACMVRRNPVGCSLFVDSGVMANTGEIVTSIDLNDPNGGGHMVGLLDASREDCAVLDNWWDLPGRVDWGAREVNADGIPRGTWRIAWPLLERAIKQCLAVRAAPFLGKAAS